MVLVFLHSRAVALSIVMNGVRFAPRVITIGDSGVARTAFICRMKRVQFLSSRVDARLSQTLIQF
jgi:hypothetical protein